MALIRLNRLLVVIFKVSFDFSVGLKTSVISVSYVPFSPAFTRFWSFFGSNLSIFENLCVHRAPSEWIMSEESDTAEACKVAEGENADSKR